MEIETRIKQVLNHYNLAGKYSRIVDRKGVESHIEQAERIIGEIRTEIYNALVKSEAKQEFDCVTCEQTFIGEESTKNGLKTSPDFCPDCLYIHSVISENIKPQL